jgi:hypothetical protein
MSANDKLNHAIVQYRKAVTFSERRRHSDRIVIKTTPFNWMIRPIFESISGRGVGAKI